MLAGFSYVRFQRENCAVGEYAEKLKQRLLSLLKSPFLLKQLKLQSHGV